MVVCSLQSAVSSLLLPHHPTNVVLTAGVTAWLWSCTQSRIFLQTCYVLFVFVNLFRCGRTEDPNDVFFDMDLCVTIVFARFVLKDLKPYSD